MRIRTARAFEACCACIEWQPKPSIGHCSTKGSQYTYLILLVHILLRVHLLPNWRQGTLQGQDLPLWLASLFGRRPSCWAVQLAGPVCNLCKQGREGRQCV